MKTDDERRGRKHRLGQCDSDQARAKQDKTGNGHSEETVRSEFFTHGTPPIARECWLPSRLSRAPARTKRLSRRTVKKIPSGSENWNLTDALEQQQPRSAMVRG
jgi:hypothetical protein